VGGGGLRSLGRGKIHAFTPDSRGGGNGEKKNTDQGNLDEKKRKGTPGATREGGSANDVRQKTFNSAQGRQRGRRGTRKPAMIVCGEGPEASRELYECYYDAGIRRRQDVNNQKKSRG